jgi:prepilin-type N-terminal cleavage/methylation domain-containing protein
MARISLKSQAREEQGFTLIELLIVIVILGILAGIAIFALGQFQTDAKKACNDANTRINQTVSAAQTAGGAGASAYASGGNCN